MLDRLFPSQVDNSFHGNRAALWLLGLLIALKVVMGVNSILNTESVAVGADGIPLDSFGAEAARQVLTLFALTALGQLALALMALAALLRWRTLVPFMFLMLLCEQVARRLIAQSFAVAGAATSAIGLAINWGIVTLLSLGLLLSLMPARRCKQAIK